jgi:hypothetical protein
MLVFGAWCSRLCLVVGVEEYAMVSGVAHGSDSVVRTSTTYRSKDGASALASTLSVTATKRLQTPSTRKPPVFPYDNLFHFLFHTPCRAYSSRSVTPASTYICSPSS